MKQPVYGMLEKARQAMQTAHLALNAGDAEGSVNRAYYAAFYLASAALWLKGEQPRTHAGVVDRFWVRFVQEDSVESRLGEVLRDAFRARQRADYDFIGRFDPVAVADLLGDVEMFVRATEALIKNLEAGGADAGSRTSGEERPS